MHSNHNVFDDLGFSREEAAALNEKARLYSKIVECARNYSQRQLQELFDEPQPRVSDLLRGKMSKFSLETLFNYAAALRMHPEIRTQEPVRVLHAARA